jgi:hypothetical protein
MASNDTAKATTAGVTQSGISTDVLLGITDGGLFDVTASGLFDVTASGLFDVTASGLFDVTASGLFDVTASGLFDVTASGLFDVTAVGDRFEGRALGKGGNGAGRWSALVRPVWCNQSKKDEGPSCAWTDAPHSNKDRDNEANTLNFIKTPRPERQRPFAATS